MEIEFRCSCGTVNEKESDFTELFVCKTCGKQYADLEFWSKDSGVLYCPACRCRDLYIQKDFNRKVGLGIVILGAILAPFTKLISLLVCALIDLILYLALPVITVCYKCHSIYRDFPKSNKHEGFNLGINDRYRSAERS